MLDIQIKYVGDLTTSEKAVLKRLTNPGPRSEAKYVLKHLPDAIVVIGSIEGKVVAWSYLRPMERFDESEEDPPKGIKWHKAGFYVKSKYRGNNLATELAAIVSFIMTDERRLLQFGSWDDVSKTFGESLPKDLFYPT
jgi:hypothetical protein